MKLKLSLLCVLFLSSLSFGAELTWTLPEDWKESAKQSSMRIATFVVKTDKNVEIAVSRFPGNVGGDLANVNRWRAQIGLSPIKSADLDKSLEVIKTKAGKAKLLDISNGDKQMIAVIVPFDQSTYFFKLTGKKTIVTREKVNVVKLVKSLKRL